MKVRVRCPAKVNLHLEVLGRRPDGYHELRTVFAAVGVWDELAFEAAPPGVFELAVEPAGAVAAGDDNLVMRAARALDARTGGGHGARIALRKRVPVGAGLGGGSANAAAALVALARLWGSCEEIHNLVPLGETLGADVPFFLLGGVAWGVGRGSEVTPLPDLPAWWLVLLPDPEPISTAEVYRRMGAPALSAAALDASRDSEIYQWVTAGGELPLGSCRNDLQPTVAGRWPEVGRRLAGVRATQPMLALLSGSGGTVFGLYGDEEGARRAAAKLAGLDLLVVPLLTREASLLRPSAGEE
jgi:4-diphosphocytidyl-2-C-methyl-D-erythritol kinase